MRQLTSVESLLVEFHLSIAARDTVKTLLVNTTIVEVVNTSPRQTRHPVFRLISARLKLLRDPASPRLLNQRQSEVLSLVLHFAIYIPDAFLSMRLAKEVPPEAGGSLGSGTLQAGHQAVGRCISRQGQRSCWTMLIFQTSSVLGLWLVIWVTVRRAVAELVARITCKARALVLTNRGGAKTTIVVLLVLSWDRELLSAVVHVVVGGLEVVASRVGAAEDVSKSLWFAALSRDNVTLAWWSSVAR